MSCETARNWVVQVQVIHASPGSRAIFGTWAVARDYLQDEGKKGRKLINWMFENLLISCKDLTISQQHTVDQTVLQLLYEAEHPNSLSSDAVGGISSIHNLQTGSRDTERSKTSLKITHPRSGRGRIQTKAVSSLGELIKPWSLSRWGSGSRSRACPNDKQRQRGST